jgi:hypothetical protein
MFRADLAMAMLTDTKPLFFSDGISWEPYIAKSANTSHGSLSKLFAGVDIKLCYIWADVREFTRSANLAFQTRQKMECVLFQEILLSVQYRLLLFDGSTSPLDEAIHTGLLTFATNVFLESVLVVRFEKLSARLRDSILGLQGLEDDSMLEFKLWLLFVAGMSIVAEDRDAWLQPEMVKTLKALRLASWKAVRDRLKGHLWIDRLHDSGGKEAFEEANNQLIRGI